MCRIEDAEPWDFFSRSSRRARKQWTCGECGRTIPVGETYDYAAGKYDGHFATCQTCQHCAAAQRWLSVACGGWVYGDVLEELVEHWEEEPGLRSWTLGRLIIGMRRKWRDGAVPVPDVTRIRASVPESARS